MGQKITSPQNGAFLQVQVTVVASLVVTDGTQFLRAGFEGAERVFQFTGISAKQGPELQDLIRAPCGTPA